MNLADLATIKARTGTTRRPIAARDDAAMRNLEMNALRRLASDRPFTLAMPELPVAHRISA